LSLVALTIAIVGLPNVGKSTLFNALTKNNVLAANYPFATIEPNVGIVSLPDPRLQALSDLFHSERIVSAPVSFVDIAGIVKGASVGEGLGNKFLVLTDDARKAALSALVAPAQAVFLDAKLESELIDLDAADAAELLASTGQEESGLNQLARIGFDTLGLQTYLTAGPKESRAWTIHKGWKAPQAAGVIHTDFEKGFIKAEVIGFDDLIATGSIAEARAKGKARIEGKDYVMQDGDVVEFRFNN
jgi:ribosome-binding ATPase YchF (GTP1/OBG family)